MRIFQELDDLLQLHLGLVGPCHIGEGHLRFVRSDEFRLGFPKLKSLVSTPLHCAEDPDPEGEEEEPRKGSEEDGPPPLPLALGIDDYALPLEEGDVVDSGGTEFEVLYTPGHSLHSIALWHASSRTLIPGDTVYADGGIGRWDLKGGDYDQLVASLTRLAELDADSM